MDYINEYENVIIRELVGKKVVFISTREIEYIRNMQEITLVKKVSEEVEIICSNRRRYVERLLEVYVKILCTNFKKYDVVFIGFAPQFVVPIFSWKFKKNLIIEDFFISFYDTLVCDRKKFAPKSKMADVTKKIDKHTLRIADLVIADTNSHKMFFSTEFKKDRSQICVYYLEANKELYYPRKAEKSEELKDKYVVIYFGSILPLQGVDIVLDAAKLFKDRADVFFEIVGPISNKYHKPIQKNIAYIDWLPQEELAEHIASADLCLAGHFNAEIEKAKRTIPGKAYIYEAMEKPMILGDNDANHEYFREDFRHRFVQMGSPEALRDIILSMKEYYNIAC